MPETETERNAMAKDVADRLTSTQLMFLYQEFVLC
jgi:hypothetical protein